MNNRKWESGAGKVGTIVGLLIPLAVIVVCIEWVPKRFDVFALQDAAEENAKSLAIGRIKEPKAREIILQRAKNLGLPLKDEGIVITEDGRSYYVQLKYTVPLDFILYSTDWNIDQKVEGVKMDI